MNAPIPLERPKQPVPDPEDMYKAELRTVPNDPDSPKSSIHIPYFKDGTPEELLKCRENLEKMFVGQALVTGPQRFAGARIFCKVKP